MTAQLARLSARNSSTDKHFSGTQSIACDLAELDNEYVRLACADWRDIFKHVKDLELLTPCDIDYIDQKLQVMRIV